MYFSRTGITANIANRFDGIPLKQYKGDAPYVLLIPSYGQPRTGNHLPKEVKQFLKQHHENMKAVIGMGNRTFGREFCLGAHKIAQHYNVPLLAEIDLVPTESQTKHILKALGDQT